MLKCISRSKICLLTKEKKSKNVTYLKNKNTKQQYTKLTEIRESPGLNQVKKHKFKMQDGKKKHQPSAEAFIICKK